MFRRDFLKFLGLAGAVAGTGVGGVLHATKDSVSQPVAVSVAPTVVEIATDVAPTEIKETLVFEFEGQRVTIVVEEGKLDYQEDLDYTYLMDRGVLEGTRYNGSTFHFTLEIRALAISDENVMQRIRESGMDGFSIIYQDMRLDNCMWEAMQYDMSSGDIYIQGRVNPKELV